MNLDRGLNIAVKLLVIVVLVITAVTVWRASQIATTGHEVSTEAGDDAKVLLKEVTETAVEAIRERKERKENAR